MEVWVLEWSCPSDNDNKVTLWSNEDDAYKQAIKEISGYINRSFDFDVSHDEACAEDFNDMVRRKQYKDAISRFTEHQDDYNQDYAQYWFVSKKPILSGDGKVAASASVQVHSNGATCRGPCKQHNPYANADQNDGTYVCRQCKTFSHIFGAKP